MRVHDACVFVRVYESVIREWDSFMHDETDFDYYYLTWIMCAYGTAGKRKRSRPRRKKEQKIVYVDAHTVHCTTQPQLVMRQH